MKNEENKSRTLSLRGYIDEVSTGSIINDILEINKEDSEKETFIKDLEPIRLHIQSCGGNTLDGFALIDIILNSRTPIYTYCDGYVESAALDVYLAGERRYAYKHSMFLIHGIKSTIEEATLSNIKSQTKWLDTVEDFGKELLLTRTNMKEEEIENIYRSHTDYYFGVDKAVEYGIVTDYLYK